ncbi:MAG TPA: PfkB family carbohydrate kinase, partial [Longimicrobiales bacterium]|nr:PfkB family carbohydrate kinase [Longimicrobiales bacterium]
MDRLTLERVDALLAAFRDVRVLVVGDLMLDRYISGAVDRISPEAPVPVVRVEEESARVGGAANVAANVAALGAACHMVGCVGKDSAGEMLRDELSAVGVRTDGLVVTDERPTTVKTRVLARHQQVVRFDREVEADVSEGLAVALVQTLEALLDASDVVVLEDYNKGVLVP